MNKLYVICMLIGLFTPMRGDVIFATRLVKDDKTVILLGDKHTLCADQFSIFQRRFAAPVPDSILLFEGMPELIVYTLFFGQEEDIAGTTLITAVARYCQATGQLTKDIENRCATMIVSTILQPLKDDRLKRMMCDGSFDWYLGKFFADKSITEAITDELVMRVADLNAWSREAGPCATIYRTIFTPARKELNKLMSMLSGTPSLSAACKYDTQVLRDFCDNYCFSLADSLFEAHVLYEIESARKRVVYVLIGQGHCDTIKNFLIQAGYASVDEGITIAADAQGLSTLAAQLFA